MIRVVICDDDAPLAEALLMDVEACFAARDVAINLSLCKSGAELQLLLDDAPPDLILLDLSLQDADGYQLAEEIRARRLRTELVFVTSHPERMPDAFCYRPIGFIEKPVAVEQLDEVIQRFLLFYWDAGVCYSVQTRGHKQQIPLRDILYFESSAHKVLIHLESQIKPLMQTRRLDEIAAELGEQPFIRIHKSFLVRADAIAQIDRSGLRIRLKDGTSLPVSRSYYAHTLEQFIQYQLR